MSLRTPIAIGILLWVSGIASYGQTAESLESQADALLASKLYEQAIPLLEQAVESNPTSQRLVSKLGQALYRSDRFSEAIDRFDQAIPLDRYSYWAAYSHYFQGRACQRFGCQTQAIDSVAALRSHFPDSFWTTHAEVMLAEVTETGVDDAIDSEDREVAANQVYKSALRYVSRREDQDAFALLDQIIAEYPDTRTALAARVSKGNLITLDSNRIAEALDEFLPVLDYLDVVAPESKVAYEVQKSVAHIYQRLDMPEAARDAFLSVADRLSNPATKTEALFQAVGALNEKLQKAYYVGVQTTQEEWMALQLEAARIKALPTATEFHKARLDLIVAEAFYWLGMRDEANAAALELIDTYDGQEYRHSVATAHFIAGESFLRDREYDNAMYHFDWIVDEFGDEEIWGGLKRRYANRDSNPADLARLHMDIFHARQGRGDSDDELFDLTVEYLDRFPNSKYTELMRGWHYLFRNKRLYDELESASSSE